MTGVGKENVVLMTLRNIAQNYAGFAGPRASASFRSGVRPDQNSRDPSILECAAARCNAESRDWFPDETGRQRAIRSSRTIEWRYARQPPAVRPRREAPARRHRDSAKRRAAPSNRQIASIAVPPRSG